MNRCGIVRRPLGGLAFRLLDALNPRTMQSLDEIEGGSSRTILETSAFSRLIKKQAHATGFEKVGIVPAHALDYEGRRLQEWVDRGFHGEMQWMARDIQRRIDPNEILPGVKSVVVVALNYYTPYTHTEDATTGKVSRYAWGDDYHDVVGSKLRALLSWIREQRTDAVGKVCVDIQAIMDKAWAVRGGLGWLGKHSNVITQEYGSWVFIGELLLNLELEYDTDQVEDHCGTCTLCIDACPTQAISEPYVVDSNRCISYATIELRSPEIPVEIEASLSGWLYGCDICQDVCPWNRFQSPSVEQRFAPREGNVNAPLPEILKLTPKEYAERFRGSAMKRAKLAGLQRNARTLLNLQSSE